VPALVARRTGGWGRSPGWQSRWALGCALSLANWCQALDLSDVELVKGICRRFTVVQGRALRHASLIPGVADERAHTVKENHAVVPFGLRQDAQDGTWAAERHSG
jgi:hypothetical protein